jgi:transposase
MISRQVREAIVRAFHDRKLSYAEIAKLLAVGEATVSRVLRRHRETGAVAPLPRGGGNFSPLCGEVLDTLRAGS